MENAERTPINLPDWARPASALAAFLYFIVITSFCLFISSRAMPPTGDEPHYLIVAHSLAVDSDLSLLNNYSKRHYRAFYPGELAKRTSPSADRKRELPAQGLGLSFFLAPFYRVFQILFPNALVISLRLVMCSITTIVLYHLIMLVSEIGIPIRYSFSTVIAGALASPIVIYSSLFYPEIPACLLLTIGIRQILRIEEHKWPAFLWLSIIPGALLWLHPKYLALAICISITTAFFFYRTFRRYPGSNHYWLTFLYTLIAAASMFSFFLFLHEQYGGWSPNRIYAGWEREPQSLIDLIRQEGIARIGTMIRMMIGFWIDQRFGLMVHAPFYVLFFSGIMFLQKSASAVKFTIVWFVIHFLILCWGAPLGGFAPPSRHLIVLLPLILIPVAKVITNLSRAKQSFSIALFLMSGIISILMYLNYRLLFTNVTWRNPDGLSLFWQEFGMNQLIPNLTATNPQWFLILMWCVVLAAITWWVYPARRISEPNP